MYEFNELKRVKIVKKIFNYVKASSNDEAFTIKYCSATFLISQKSNTQ
jgi:hypothetical protein